MSNEINTAVSTDLFDTTDAAETNASDTAETDATDTTETDATDTKILSNQIDEARQIAEHLYNLLHEDALHRLDLYQKYAHDNNASRWSPDLYKRCQLIEALRRKLNTIIG